MKKLLLICILFVFSQINAQILPLLEEDNNRSKKVSKVTFEALKKRGETIFKNIDINKKGSGYKPFKRWEYHWSHYLQEDGTIAPVEHLWKAWEQKNKLAKSSKAVSNWTDKGPFDQSSKSGQGRINTIAVDPNKPNIIYVGAPAGGLWKSTDNGVNWTPLTDDLPQIGVSGIAIVPDPNPNNESKTIYIATGDDDAADSYSVGVLKSTDGGTTWSQTGSLAGNPIYTNEIVLDPTNSNTIWLGSSTGLFKSINGGTNWSQMISGQHIRDFKLKPGDPNTIYAVSSDTFYKSTNGGTNFTSNSTGLPSASSLGRLRVEVTAASGAANNVYVLAAKTRNQNYAFQGIYKSTNSGINFSKTAENDDIFGSSQAWFDLAFVISPTNPDIMFVGVLDIWKSTNQGDNFVKINDWRTVNSTFTHADIHFMRYYGNVLYAGTDGGVFRSTNNGQTFTDLTKNLSISQIYKVSVSKQTSAKLAGGLQDNGGFSLTNNTWHNYHGGDGMDAASDPNDQNKFYGFTQFGGALSVTTNGGLTSNRYFVSGPVQGNWVTPLVINKLSEIYAGYDQLYKLINNSWTKVSDHSFGGKLESIEIDPSNNKNIYTSIGRNLYRSNDEGKTFTTHFSFQTGISGVNISSIEVHNSNSNIIWVTTTGVNNLSGPSSGHTGGGVFKSTDGGQTFTNITSGLPNESKFVVRHHPFTTNNSIYVGTALGVYHRNDDTNTWEVFSTNLPNVAVTDLEINPYDATITASTYGRSIWQSPIPSTTIPAIDIDLAKVDSPNNTTVSCGSIAPKITVLNNGANALTSFTVNYNIDGGSNSVYNWSGNLASGATTSITLPNISTSSEGEHILNTELVLSNDFNSFNNKSSSKFIINSSSQGKVVHPFNNPTNDKWQNTGNLWQIGNPSTVNKPDLGALGVSGYVTNLTGNHPDQTTAHLISPCYNLTTLENPVLKFKMAFDLGPNFDIIYVEYSKDQGNTWQILGTANDPNWYNSNRTLASSGNLDCHNCPGAQWTGKDVTLKNYSYNLSALNNESSIMFRFKFVSDPATNDEGVLIDDFVVDATRVLAVDNLDASNFLIYPNPSSGSYNIRRVNSLAEDMNVKVFDITGKLIVNQKNITDTNYELKMSNAEKGIYFLKITIDNRFLTKKLILK